ncbi:MAG: hypothetical protein M3460_03360 [Actinomycetota bacterium]|nr:hypothetical protein [Actinomycetota bacterium]
MLDGGSADDQQGGVRDPYGLGTLSLLKGDVVRSADSLRPVHGCLPVPRTPPTPDAVLLDTHAMIDPERQQRWRARLVRVSAELNRTTGLR